jgi:AcrR family transcriptional regulator
MVTARRPPLPDLILDATERLIGRYGYGKMTMDDIAAEAGVARRSIYVHFAGKAEVALASIDRVVADLLRAMQAIAAAEAPAEDRLRDLLVTRVMFRFDRVAAYRDGLETLFAELRPAYLARRAGYFAAEARVLAGVLAEGRRRGRLAVADPAATAHDLLLATNALIPYSLSPAELGDRAQVDRQAHRLAELLLAGVVRRNKGELHAPSRRRPRRSGPARRRRLGSEAGVRPAVPPRRP